MPPVDIASARASAAEESIDLPLFDVSVESPELGKKLVKAAAEWGFLWIVASPPPDNKNNESYDFDEETVDRVFSVSREFFLDAAMEEKEPCRIKHNRGWVDMHVENLDPSQHKRGDFKQAFNLAEPLDGGHGDWVQPMPATFQRHDARLRDFHARCRRLSTRILRLLALGLEIEDPDWIARTHEQAPNTARFLFYPQLPPGTDYSQESDIRAGAHSDYGSITLLFQRPSQPGLELLTPDGTWASVPIFPPGYHSTALPPIVVNIGDLLSYWTNGFLKSTIHRVILTEPGDTEGAAQSGDVMKSGLGENRFSIAIFIQPSRATEIVPMPSPLVASRAAEFARETVGHGGGIQTETGKGSITAGDYLDGRLMATYGSVYQPVKASS
ncbi:hypothetical protein MPDQ_006740 [Monascus purpureus]|uniref:Fe2OG dioxygenase domain-containing protein n=1 Tax=Monascus purpureus TaxID=5098 RepID=A0A507QXE6_MONPU|nr:hypothetical protein MPDQ_006740 [Monascus purpureus]BDD62323.1 hypothetical protein MAP00_007294 [Monascus purpureus]